MGGRIIRSGRSGLRGIMRGIERRQGSFEGLDDGRASFGMVGRIWRLEALPFDIEDGHLGPE